jgi:membrane-associated phospholipid phosphatase
MEAKPKIMIASASSLIRPLCSEWLLPDRAMKRRLWPLAVGIGYVALIGRIGGLRADHVGMGALVLLDYYNRRTRMFLACFAPFIATGLIFDSMRYFYWKGVAGHIHVAEPYYRELAWFGIPELVDGVRGKVTPNEFFVRHHWAPLDLLCGFAYLTYVGEYLLTAFYLFFDRQFFWLRRFGACFLTVNVLGFATYFVYPAAPPWYVSQYGLGPARMDVQPGAAAAQRFDQLLGTHFFDQIYGRGIDVYGAYPSLHVSYPFLVMLIAFQLPRLKYARLPAVLFYCLMCLSAVYLQHHYIVDILLGTTYAAATWWIIMRAWPVQEALA